GEVVCGEEDAEVLGVADGSGASAVGDSEHPASDTGTADAVSAVMKRRLVQSCRSRAGSLVTTRTSVCRSSSGE
ncbi:hypothetical protein, partial [Streptomyces spongiae]|uniref:hypothetical protein n=1 Tax=Streptomyces spongiae TaxID=565072 RepID=UPI001D15AAAB